MNDSREELGEKITALFHSESEVHSTLTVNLLVIVLIVLNYQYLNFS